MEIIFYIIFSLVLLGLCGLVAYNTYKDINKNVISFYESYNLTNLPIITFNCGKKKLNFILDSGATCCVINSTVNSTLSESNTSKSLYKNEIMGMEGNVVEVDSVYLNLSYKNLQFCEAFLTQDLSKAFAEIKKENGVTVHGLLGNDFLTKHKYILDFNKMIFYSKK